MDPASVASRKVVIDAGAAIKLQRLERFGGEIYTTSGVVNEIRDERARALLGTLPMELRIRQPQSRDIAYVKHFAKLTGDLGTLSQNDIELMALTVGLHRESGGVALRDRPGTVTMSQVEDKGHDWAPVPVRKTRGTPAVDNLGSGGSVEKEKPSVNPSASTLDGAAVAVSKSAVEDEDDEGDQNEPAAEDEAVDGAREHELGAALALSRLRARKIDGNTGASTDTANEPAPEPTPSAIPSQERAADLVVLPNDGAVQEVEEPAAKEDEDDGEAWSVVPPKSGAVQAVVEPAANEDQEDGDDWSEDGSSAGEWVTADNIDQFGQGERTIVDTSRVTCATADYAVQNVLLQMGITPLTFEGYAVQSVRLWGLLCRACFHFSRDTTKVFCPKCGNATVLRVPIHVDKDGKATVLNAGRTIRKKGTVYSIPKPQGGRGFKPIFAEDELMIGGRDKALRHAQKLADKERAARDPFNADNGAKAWYQRGTTATGKQLGLNAPRVQVGYGRVNPNANNFKFKRGKK